MCVEIKQAVELYDQARRAEEEGKIILAEIYYLKSVALFEQVGGRHYLNAADGLNVLAFLRASHGYYEGALYSAKKSAQIIESLGAEFSGRDADEILLQAWALIENVYRQMAHYPEAEKILQRSFDYALPKFDDADEETASVCNPCGVFTAGTPLPKISTNSTLTGFSLFASFSFSSQHQETRRSRDGRLFPINL